jgi:hypothetical protein
MNNLIYFKYAEKNPFALNEKTSKDFKVTLDLLKNNIILHIYDDR